MDNDRNKKGVIKVEIKKRFNIFEQRKLNEQIPKNTETINKTPEENKPKETIAEKLSKSNSDFKRALFFGDKALANKIRAEQSEYRKTFIKRPVQGVINNDRTPTRRPPQAPFLSRFQPPTPSALSKNPKPQVPKQKRDFFSKKKTSLRPKVEESVIKFSSNMLGSVEELGNIGRERTRSFASINRAKEKRRGDITPKDILITGNTSVKELAANMSVKAKEVVDKLRELGVIVNSQSIIDTEIAQFLVQDFGHRPKIKESILQKVKLASVVSEGKDERAPIVAVVGHVDHGKTSLLDALRKTNVASKESGGITQSIGASQVYVGKDFITFIDTPGHKLFVSMREKGINITDIVLLVIAADDGIKEQTVESIKYAKAAGVFIIVVITKADKASEADVEKIRRALFTHEIIVESMGGNAPEILVSSKTGKNIKELVELIILSGQVLNLRADNTSTGYGKVLDSYLDKYKGPIANVIMCNGNIKKGEFFLSGKVSGKIKSITDWEGKNLSEAGPSFPVQISGFESIVEAGTDFVIMKNQAEVREAVLKRLKLEEENKETKIQLYSINDIWKQLVGEEEVKELRFLVKADSHASVEALVAALTVEDSMQINRHVVNSGIGAITESDVQAAKTSEAKIIAFNVDSSPSIIKIAKTLGVEIRRYDVIYKIFDDIDEEVEKMFTPKEILTEIGKAEIRKVFAKPKYIAGCIVLNGVMKRNQIGVVIRDNKELWRGKILSIKQVKEDLKEAKTGQECGIFMEDFEGYKVGDTIKCFEVTKND